MVFGWHRTQSLAHFLVVRRRSQEARAANRSESRWTRLGGILEFLSLSKPTLVRSKHYTGGPMEFPLRIYCLGNAAYLWPLNCTKLLFENSQTEYALSIVYAIARSSDRTIDGRIVRLCKRPTEESVGRSIQRPTFRAVLAKVVLTSQ